MTRLDQPNNWEVPHAGVSKSPYKRQKKKTDLSFSGTQTIDDPHFSTFTISERWTLPEIPEDEGISNLDDLPPEAVYYLGLVTDLPLVAEIYAEHLESSSLKVWTVLHERDFDVMDEIYNIEQDVLDRFPGVDIQFRVTVKSDNGPSVASSGVQIFESE